MAREEKSAFMDQRRERVAPYFSIKAVPLFSCLCSIMLQFTVSPLKRIPLWLSRKERLPYKPSCKPACPKPTGR